MNETLNALDGLVQLSVISASLAESDRYIVAAGATGLLLVLNAGIAVRLKLFG